MTHSPPLSTPPSTAAARTLRVAPLLLVLTCIVPLLTSCGLHSGAGVLAFLRGGALWTIQSDGSSPMQIAGYGVAGFAWSPDHHQFVVRFGSNDFPRPPQSPLGAPDSPANLGIVSVNGGSALQITPQGNGVLRSDGWWDANGNRLLYREQLNGSGQPPTYYVSQADQAVGIARKPVFAPATIPALAPDGHQVAVVDSAGNLRLGPPDTLGAVIATGALSSLPNTARPARVLWQPRANALLYETAATLGVSLVLRDLPSGTARTLVSLPSLLDAAFSPDGTLLLVRTPSDFRLYSVATGGTPLFSWQETDPLALPWWSPDSHTILVQNSTGWQQVDTVHHTVRTILAYSQPGASAALGTTTNWHPAAVSPYSPDGSQFVFAAPAGSQWLGSQLPSPQNSSTALYVAAAPVAGSGQPARIDSGADFAPGWSYLDPSTAFLVAS